MKRTNRLWAGRSRLLREHISNDCSWPIAAVNVNGIVYRGRSFKGRAVVQDWYGKMGRALYAFVLKRFVVSRSNPSSSLSAVIYAGNDSIF
ncbi:hypothetical protein D3C77_273380 [compost metagenome]